MRLANVKIAGVIESVESMNVKNNLNRYVKYSCISNLFKAYILSILYQQAGIRYYVYFLEQMILPVLGFSSVLF